MIFLILNLLLMILIMNMSYIVVSRIIRFYRTNRLFESINTMKDLIYMNSSDLVSVTAKMLKLKGNEVKVTDKCGEEGNGLILNNLIFTEVWKQSIGHSMEIESAMKLARQMKVNKVYRGMIVTTGSFKNNTLSFCHKNVIRCINGNQLLGMIKEVQIKRTPATDIFQS